jgi:hypothetical protein
MSILTIKTKGYEIFFHLIRKKLPSFSLAVTVAIFFPSCGKGLHSHLALKIRGFDILF